MVDSLKLISIYFSFSYVFLLHLYLNGSLCIRRSNILQKRLYQLYISPLSHCSILVCITMHSPIYDNISEIKLCNLGKSSKQIFYLIFSNLCIFIRASLPYNSSSLNLVKLYLLIHH